jgi:hypothetical protein
VALPATPETLFKMLRSPNDKRGQQIEIEVERVVVIYYEAVFALTEIANYYSVSGF